MLTNPKTTSENLVPCLFTWSTSHAWSGHDRLGLQKYTYPRTTAPNVDCCGCKDIHFRPHPNTTIIPNCASILLGWERLRLALGEPFPRLIMSNFLVELFSSIFTPGPTHTLLVATNVSFAALQALLLALLIATYSVHFIVLSFLCAGLWWAINWFAAELQSAAAEEEEARKLEEKGRERRSAGIDDSGTDTEAAEEATDRGDNKHQQQGNLKPPEVQGARKRHSFGDQSGDLSTDSEWEKVEEEGRDR